MIKNMGSLLKEVSARPEKKWFSMLPAVESLSFPELRELQLFLIEKDARSSISRLIWNKKLSDHFLLPLMKAAAGELPSAKEDVGRFSRSQFIFDEYVRSERDLPRGAIESLKKTASAEVEGRQDGRFWTRYAIRRLVQGGTLVGEEDLLFVLTHPLPEPGVWVEAVRHPNATGAIRLAAVDRALSSAQALTSLCEVESFITDPEVRQSLKGSDRCYAWEALVPTSSGEELAELLWAVGEKEPDRFTELLRKNKGQRLETLRENDWKALLKHPRREVRLELLKRLSSRNADISKAVSKKERLR